MISHVIAADIFLPHNKPLMKRRKKRVKRKREGRRKDNNEEKTMNIITHINETGMPCVQKVWQLILIVLLFVT